MYITAGCSSSKENNVDEDDKRGGFLKLGITLT